jgi:hypothetical protein
MVLQIAILGSLEAHVNGALVCVPAGKQRALLTLLTVRAPHPVSAESVAEALWPRAAPAEAMRRLRVTASRLRRSLGRAGSILETVASGYRLAVEADAIDARRFETLIGEARAARVGGDAAAARRLLDDALELWRGSALADASFALLAGVSQVHVRRPRRTMPSRLGGLTAASATPRHASVLPVGARALGPRRSRAPRSRKAGRPPTLSALMRRGPNTSFWYGVGRLAS